MARFALLLLAACLPSAAGATCRLCKGISAVVTDDWCEQNCNAEVPQCPSTLCKCQAPPPTPPVPKVIGYYSPVWDKGSKGPAGANVGVCFSGWVDPDQALAPYPGPPLQGDKYVSFGGGNHNGRFTDARLKNVTAAIAAGAVNRAGYVGVVFDVEECDAGLAGAFSTAFAASKKAGLQVVMTTSHSSPYGCADGKALVQAFTKDPNIDLLSPQLYTSGAEVCPNFSETEDAGVAWSMWKNAKAPLAPSIGNDAQWPVVSQWAQSQGLALEGFFQWAEVH